MVGKCLAYALNGQIIRSAVRNLIMCKSWLQYKLYYFAIYLSIYFELI
jgi:hypothetical protein